MIFSLMTYYYWVYTYNPSGILSHEMLKIRLFSILHHKLVINKTYNISLSEFSFTFTSQKCFALYEEGSTKLLMLSFTTRIVTDKFCQMTEN